MTEKLVLKSWIKQWVCEISVQGSLDELSSNKSILASIKEEIEKFPTGKFVLKKTIENVVEEDPNASGQKDQESDQKVSQGHDRTVTVIWDGNVFFVTGDP